MELNNTKGIDDDHDRASNNRSRSQVQHRPIVDRPPRSPIRTTSRKIPQFTRSRVYPSIRRKRTLPIPAVSNLKNATPTIVVSAQWIRVCTIWVITFLVLTCTYWYNVQKIIVLRLLPLQQHHQGLNQTTSPDLTTAFVEQQQRMRRRVRKEDLMDESNIVHRATMNDGTTGTPRSREERIAPLLEVIYKGSLNISTASNWSLHYVPALPTADSDGNSRSCIVTAYFKLSSSKHHADQYDQWMQNMLSMHDCMVIYCEAEMVPKIVQYRTNHTPSVTHSIGPTAIIEMSLNDLPISKYYSNSDTSPSDFWNRQLRIDPERQMHKSYELFWIWLSKTWFVTTAAVLQQDLFRDNTNTTAIETWMWADIGSFRGTEYMNQQLIQQEQHAEIFPDGDTVIWMAHRKPNPPPDPYWNRKLLKNEKRHFYHSGSQGIANSVRAWIEYHTHFVSTLDEYATNDLFIGEDQCVLQTTCLLYPKSCAYIPCNQVDDNRYFGLRHVVRYGPFNHSSSNRTIHPFVLWRPPLRQPVTSIQES